jgi:WLM domain
MVKQFKENILLFIVAGFIIFICFRMYRDSDKYNLKCLVSEVDGNRYCVRDRIMNKESVDLLAKVTNNMTRLVDYMKVTYPNNSSVKFLVSNYRPNKINETLPTSELTAYSENKGEKIAFCLNKTKDGKKLIDLNTLTFVAIHELAHLMTTSIGHKQDFWMNFKFLLENAKKIKIYNPVDYKKNNQPYCGMNISDNPLFDM